MMPRLYSALLLAFTCSSLCWAQNQQEPAANLYNDALVNLDELVNLLPEELVTTRLAAETAPRYRDGIFEDGRRARDAIQDEAPELAAKVLEEALHLEMRRIDLRKRQSPNSTSAVSTMINTMTIAKTTSIGSAPPSESAI